MFTDGNCSSFLNSTLLFQFTVSTILFIKKERDFFSLLIVIPYHRPASCRTYYCMLLDTEFTLWKEPIFVSFLFKGSYCSYPFQHQFIPVVNFSISSISDHFTCSKSLFLSLIHISEPTRLLSISYAVFCLKKQKTN